MKKTKKVITTQEESTSAVASRGKTVNSVTFIRHLEIAVGREFEGAETALLKALIEDGSLSFEEIAALTEYSMYYLRGQVGPRLWEDLTTVFSPAFHSTIGKRNFSSFVQYFSGKLSSVPSSVLKNGVARHQFAEIFGIELGGNANPGVETLISRSGSFYGRLTELDRLTDLLQRHRTVALLGGMGVGKTTLAARWVEQFGEGFFDRIIWKSIVHAPEPDLLFSELLQEFKLEDRPQTLPEKLSALMQFMKQQRCLIVLDSAEQIIINPAITAINPYTSPEYARVIRFLVEEPHQSCVLLVSRRPFQDVVRLEQSNRSATVMELDGLQPHEAQQILEAYELKDSNDWKRLIKQYAGNPAYLISISDYIQNVFNGSVRQFLRCDTIIFPDAACRECVEQIQALSEDHRTVLFHLATLRESIHYEQLLIDLSDSIKSQSSLIRCLNDLTEMGLVEKKQENALLFALAPLAKKVILIFPFRSNS